MWTNIFAAYVTDRIALLVHGYLLTLSVLATVCCIRGILWEVSGPLNVHDFARKLVIWGVSFEAIFTIALLMFDEGISGTQQSRIEAQQATIISLQNRLAARTLTSSQLRAVTDAVAQYGGIKFELGTYMHVPECVALTAQIGSALKNAKWDLVPINGEPFSVIAGVVVTANAYVCDDKGANCSPNTPPEEDEAAEALVKALEGAGIEASHLPKEALVGNPTRIAVAVYIGIKP